jgi:hypothetical protein
MNQRSSTAAIVTVGAASDTVLKGATHATVDGGSAAISTI